MWSPKPLLSLMRNWRMKAPGPTHSIVYRARCGFTASLAREFTRGEF